MSGVDILANSTPPKVTLTNQQAIANGAALDNVTCRANHTVQILSSAGVSAGSVQLQGSLDGVSWFNMGAAVAVNAASSVFSLSVTGTPARFVRANVSVAITGGTVGALVGSA